MSKTKIPILRGAGLSVALLLLLGLLWGGSTNIARYVGSVGVPALAYAFWIALIGSIVLSVINLVRRQAIPTSKRHLLYFLGAGALTSGLPTANMFLCLNYISVGAMSLVLTMVPIFTYLLSLLLLIEKPNVRRGIGISLGLAGALLVVLPDNGLPADQPIGWFMLAFLSPLSYAAGNVFTAKVRPQDIDDLASANGMLFASALILLIASLATQQWFSIWSEVSLANSLVMMHGLISAIAFTLFFLLVRIAGPVYFSQVAYLVTFFGIAIAMVVFDERYSVWHWAAFAVTVTGVILVNRAQTRGVNAAQKS